MHFLCFGTDSQKEGMRFAQFTDANCPHFESGRKGRRLPILQLYILSYTINIS